ncbi:MAG: hypothetical protein ACFB0C_02060 [Leptolyngbyaceae cyanobacterium]
MQRIQSTFAYVEEQNEPFLALWPHRYDYIWAEHPEPKGKPKWHTESRHPLSDRLILQGSYLYGVRFGPTTHYIMVDIDRGSPYHPGQDPLALPKLKAALEDLGLVSALICTSSDSGGLHLYYPFSETQKTWEIALAVATLLENQGFKQTPGHLELYPNPRNFATKGAPTLYRGHRLPLQTGSYILNESYEPISSSQSRFIEKWTQTQTKNDLNSITLKAVLKASRRREYRVTTKAEKFLNDLNAEIERGWTGPGMTNRLLGRITLRSYIFGHVLRHECPLSGKVLEDDIVETAQNLPGFYEWSNHVHELEEKARDWARSIERTKRYFPYGTPKNISTEDTDKTPSYHEQLAANAREKIRMAIATLLNEAQLPSKVGERFKLLANRFHIGGATLYKHKDLWHPDHLMDPVPTDITVEIPPNPPVLEVTSGLGRYEGAPSPERHTSLLEQKSRKPLSNKKSKHNANVILDGESCNNNGQLPLFEVTRAIAAVRAQQQQKQAQHRANQAKRRQQQVEDNQKAYVERMRQYLGSGDPILMGEALQWLQEHPGRLDEIL